MTPNFPSFLILPPMRRITHEGWLHLIRICSVRLDSTALNYPWPLALKKTRQEWPPGTGGVPPPLRSTQNDHLL